MLEFWKPLKVNKTEETIVAFSYDAQKMYYVPVNDWVMPFILFYNEEDDCYYYLLSKRYKWWHCKTFEDINREFFKQMFYSQVENEDTWEYRPKVPFYEFELAEFDNNKNILLENDFIKISEGKITLSEKGKYYSDHPQEEFKFLYRSKLHTIREYNPILNDSVLLTKVELQQQSKGVMTTNWCVECTNVFKMKRELLESLIDTSDKDIIDTQKVSIQEQTEIIELLKHFICRDEPDISLMEVMQDEKGDIIAKSLYMGPAQYRWIWWDHDCYIPEDEERYKVFCSEKSVDDKLSNDRYETGLKFKDVFIKKMHIE